MANILDPTENISTPNGLKNIYTKLKEIIRVLNVAVTNIATNTINIASNTASISSITPTYKVYSALLTQTSTNAPVVIVLQNTLGAVPVWTRRLQGIYDVDLLGAFTVGKTFVMICKSSNGGANFSFYQVDANQIEVVTEEFNAAGPSFDAEDGLLDSTSIEIRVYI